MTTRSPRGIRAAPATLATLIAVCAAAAPSAYAAPARTHGRIGTGSDTGPGVPADLTMTWQWHPGSPEIISRQTLIDMVALPSGATGIRVDALVIYRIPRPADVTEPTSA